MIELSNAANSPPHNWFNLFIKDTEFELITSEANQYFHQINSLKQSNVHVYINSRCDVYIDKMKKFLGLIYWRGWWKNQYSVHIGSWSNSSLQWHLENICQRIVLWTLLFLHLSVNTADLKRNDSNYDPIYKGRPIYIITSQFHDVCHFEKNLCINKGIVLWRGCLNFRKNWN